MIRVKVADLGVARGSSLVVREVSFEAQSGEWLGLVGANGSGKTSLLRALAGRLDLTTGKVFIDGQDVTSKRADRARMIGFAPDAASLPSRMVVGQLFSLLAGRSGEARGAGLNSLRVALGIDNLVGRRIGELSSGNRQRVAIFSAFMAQDVAKVVILDEPFNWLDPVCAYELRNALTSLVADGLTLITALHDLTSWTMFCDHGLLLSKGIIASDLSKSDLLEGRKDTVGFERQIINKLRD